MQRDTPADDSRTVDVTDLMALPETGGRADEIGGHVEINASLVRETVVCPECETECSVDAIGHGCTDGFRRHPAGKPGESA